MLKTFGAENTEWNNWNWYEFKFQYKSNKKEHPLNLQISWRLVITLQRSESSHFSGCTISATMQHGPRYVQNVVGYKRKYPYQKQTQIIWKTNLPFVLHDHLFSWLVLYLISRIPTTEDKKLTWEQHSNFWKTCHKNADHGWIWLVSTHIPKQSKELDSRNYVKTK